MEKNKSRVEQQFCDILKETVEECIFMQFDVFIIREMGFDFKNVKELEEQRRPAFRKFRKMTNQYEFASLPTIRRWFGITRIAKPSREQVLEICLTMQTGYQKATEYLMMGLGETSIQFSDYREIIFAYGLQNQLTYEQCKQIIKQFETAWSGETSNVPKANMVETIKSEFEYIKDQGEERFVEWLLTHQKMFLGYNPIVMNILNRYKKLALEYIREEAVERLDSLLAETDFRNWVSKRKKGEGLERELIKKYVNHQKDDKYYKISENMRDNILELSKIVYSELESNSRLLAEVFSPSNKPERRKGIINFHNIQSMTAKHLSDLYNIPLQKVRSISITAASYQIAGMDGAAPCPEEILNMHHSFTRNDKELANISEAREWLNTFGKEQHRRVLNIHRSDILPIIHYLAQHQYLESVSSKQLEYNYKKAKKVFIDLANRTLVKFHMAKINRFFEIDAVLLACYQPEEMYSFSEVLDVVEGRM